MDISNHLVGESKKRIFIGIELPDDVRRAVVRRIDEFKKRFSTSKVKWEQPEKLHITLNFLGDADINSIPGIVRNLKRTLTDLNEFALSIESPGVFPKSSNPRILWLGVKDERKILEQTAEKLSRDLEKLGFERERRKFHPHLTIGRIRDAESARELVRAHLNEKFEPAAFSVSKIAIFESKLNSTGSIYEITERSAI